MSILDSLNSMITPDVSKRLAGSLGVDPALFQKGVSAIGPLALGALAQRASTPTGAADLLQKLPQDTEPSFFKTLLGGLGGGQAGLTNTLLGNGANAIGASLSQALGFNVRPLLTMAVPLVGGFISKMVREKKFAAADLTNVLQKESNDYLANPANAETAKLVKSALDDGQRAEKLRSSFANAEWLKVRRAPVAALYMVASASPSGLIGLTEEFSAAAKAVASSGEAAAPTSIVASAFGSGIEKEDLKALQEEKPNADRLFAEIHDAYVVISNKGAPEAAAFRELVMKVAQSTAEASKEGGFLGIGGTRVSADERRALDRIQGALH